MSGFEVCETQCDQCLFGENRVVSKARMADILKDCRRKDTYFVCHKATIEGRDVCCKGFYDTQTSQLIRVARSLNAVQMVSVPQTNKATTC